MLMNSKQLILYNLSPACISGVFYWQPRQRLKTLTGVEQGGKIFYKLKNKMYQQNYKQQIANRSSSISWYNTFMPTGYAVLFGDAINYKNITRLCKANE